MFKKVLIIALALSTTLSSVALASSQGYTTGLNGTRRLSDEEVAKLHNQEIPEVTFPGKGFMFDACPSLDGQGNKKTENQIKEDIYEKTNLHISTEKGMLYLEDETVWLNEQELVSAEKNTLPDTKIANLPYTQNWNGIQNFIFPNAYYTEGTFETIADSQHHVKLYSLDGTYAGSVKAASENGKYITAINIDDGDFYAVIFNDSDSVSSNATYTIR